MKLRKRSGVSELYASLLMIGVTLSFGSFVAASAIDQFNKSNYSGSLAVAAQQASAGKLISYVYAASTPSGSCPLYGGNREGTTFSLALYNYGTAAFSPTEVFVNSTLYSGGGYSSIAAGSMATYALTLPSCAHTSGQTILLVDAYGDEVQFGT